MPLFKVRPDTADALMKRMEQLGIAEKDLSETFVRGSGPGGQKKNKVSSCVQLKHLPSGIEVRCQKDRSQSMNRYYARLELCDRIEQQQTGNVQREAAERYRERRRKQRRSRRAKVKNVADKRAHSATKSMRRKPGNSD